MKEYVPKSKRTISGKVVAKEPFFKKKTPVWIEKAAERIARMVCARGRFTMRHMNRLSEEIEKIITDVKEEWG